MACEALANPLGNRPAGRIGTVRHNSIMTARRAVGILLAVVAGVAAVFVMVRYTRRVETDLRTAPAAAGTVKLLKDRQTIAPLTGVDLDGRPVSTASLRGKV